MGSAHRLRIAAAFLLVVGAPSALGGFVCTPEELKALLQSAVRLAESLEDSVERAAEQLESTGNAGPLLDLLRQRVAPVLEVGSSEVDGASATALGSGSGKPIPGEMNAGVFAYRGRDGNPRVTKLLKVDVAALLTALGKLNAAALSEEELLALKDLARQLYGAELGQGEGGPEVKSIGFARNKNDGSVHFQITTEELYPGDSGRITLRELLTERPNAERIAVLTRRGTSGVTPVEALPKMLISALQKGVVPVDPDVMISSQGAIRWIDTNLWEHPTSEAAYRKAVEKTMRLMFDGLEDTPQLARDFMTSFLSDLKNDPAIPERSKGIILDEITSPFNTPKLYEWGRQRLSEAGLMTPDSNTLSPHDALRRFYAGIPAHGPALVADIQAKITEDNRFISIQTANGRLDANVLNVDESRGRSQIVAEVWDPAHDTVVLRPLTEPEVQSMSSSPTAAREFNAMTFDSFPGLTYENRYISFRVGGRGKVALGCIDSVVTEASTGKSVMIAEVVDPQSGQTRTRELTPSERDSAKTSQVSRDHWHARPPHDSNVRAGPILPDDAQQMLGQTVIASVRRVQLVEDMREANLLPKQTVVVGNAKYSLTDVFMADGKPNVLAVVEVNGQRALQTFRRSGSQGLFRLIPARGAGWWWGKISPEAAQDAPVELQTYLGEQLAQGHVRRDVPAKVCDDAIPSYNNVVGAVRAMAADPNLKFQPEELLVPPKPGDRILEDQSKQEFPLPESVAVRDPALAPDYSAAPMTYNSVSDVAGSIKAYVYPSKDGSIKYTFFEDRTGHVWISQVSDVHAAINAAGLRTAVIDAGALVTPLWEYHELIPNGYARPGVKAGSHEQYGNAWPYLREIPLIRDFYRARGLPVPP